VDKVNELMDDVNEQVAMADEIGEAMAQTLGNDDIEEEDLEKELEELQNEEMEAEMLQAPEVPVSEQKSEKVEQKQPAIVEVKGDLLAELASAPSAPVSKPEVKQNKELEAITAGLGI